MSDVTPQPSTYPTFSGTDDHTQLRSTAADTRTALVAATAVYKDALTQHNIAVGVLLDSFAKSVETKSAEDQQQAWQEFLDTNQAILPPHTIAYCNMNYTINSCEWVNCIKTATTPDP